MTKNRNSIERIAETIKFGSPDRVPVIPQIFGHSAIVSGNNFHDYLTKGEILAKSQLEALEYYGNDAVFGVMDVNVETNAMGSKLKFPQDLYPHISEYVLKIEGEQIDYSRLIDPDPQTSGRMPEILKALKILRKNLGDDVLVVGAVLGPLTLAIQLIGIEQTLFYAVDYPKEFIKLLDITERVIQSYGIAQIESGAHLPLIFEPAGSQAVIPKAFFEKYLQHRITRIFKEFKQKGAIANWLHIAGPTQKILPLYTQMGADVGNFDFCVSTSDIKNLVPDKLCVDGNINSIHFTNQPPNIILEESTRLINEFNQRGGFILSSGCEIPPESKPTLIKEMIHAAKQPFL
jgi:uroporphyrinogen decarboxylase